MEEQHEERRISIEAFNKLADDVKTIKTALLGDMNNCGWLSRIRAAENTLKLYKWIITSIGGVVVAIGINIVSSYFTK